MAGIFKLCNMEDHFEEWLEIKWDPLQLGLLT